MSLKHPAKAALLICMCAMLCACGTAPAISDSAASDMPQSESTTVQTTTTATQTTTTTTTATTTSAKPDEPEYPFVSVLTEDDIEYMGIPYKDLTIEQFIQLWAQCTRETNVQRLYVITYNNDNSTKELYDRWFVNHLMGAEEMGYMLFMYHDVELFEVEDAPEGYYDGDESEPHFYLIEFRRVWVGQGTRGEEYESRWIQLKKINGYWKIGSSHSSSPPFLDPYN